jgi:hypothetical protein
LRGCVIISILKWSCRHWRRKAQHQKDGGDDTHQGLLYSTFGKSGTPRTARIEQTNPAIVVN